MTTFKTRDLLSALKYTVQAVPDKSTLPILQYALVSIRNNKAEIRATDLQIEIVATVPCTSPDITFALHFADFSRLLPTLTSEEITLAVGSKLQLISNKDKFSFAATDATVFPAAKQMHSNSVQLEVKQDFIDSMKEAAKHDPGDVLRPQFKGCCINFLDEKVEIAGGMNKFYINELPYKSTGRYHIEPSFISAVKSEGLLQFDKESVRLVSGNVQITGSLSAIPFVDYDAIYPEELLPNVYFNLSDLLPKLDAILSFGDPDFTTVLLQFNTDIIDVIYVNKKFEREYNSSIPCVNSFGEVSVAYNAAFLKSILQSAGKDKIELMLISDSKPTYIIVPGFKNAISVLQK